VKITRPVRKAEKMRTICDVRAVIGSQLASEAREPASTHHLEEHGGTVVSPQAQRCGNQSAADNMPASNSSSFT
jgi:hypothetical protein